MDDGPGLIFKGLFTAMYGLIYAGLWGTPGNR